MNIGKFLFHSIFVLFILFGCSGEPPTQIDDQSSGNVSLKFDKANAPESVVLVQATLTRDTFDPVIGQLDLINSNSAEILFTEIQAGTWHLVVDAMDSQMAVLFTGETDLTVIAGEISTVNLTLSPTGNGTGAIYLTVNWGVASQYIDYPQNPIVVKQGTPYDPFGVRMPCILFDNGIYHMWYFSLADHGKSVINLATSTNGLDWNISSNQPVLLPGSFGSWDDLAVAAPVVIKDNGIFKMYYTGYRDSFGQWFIGLATSMDGTIWEKLPNPVLSGSAMTGEFKIKADDIIKIDNTYYMYYYGKNDIYDYKNFKASSTDGILWNKLGEYNLGQSQSWEGTKIGAVSIVNHDNEFKMIYMSNDETGIKGFGEAYSEDGISWTKYSNNPVFIKEMAVNSYWQIGDPHLAILENEFRIYYSGWVGDVASINVARKFIY